MPLLIAADSFVEAYRILNMKLREEKMRMLNGRIT